MLRSTLAHFNLQILQPSVYIRKENADKLELVYYQLTSSIILQPDGSWCPSLKSFIVNSQLSGSFKPKEFQSLLHLWKKSLKLQPQNLPCLYCQLRMDETVEKPSLGKAWALDRNNLSIKQSTVSVANVMCHASVTPV